MNKFVIPFILLLASVAHAQTFDKPETRADVAKWKLYRIVMNAEDSRAVVEYMKQDAEGNYVGESTAVEFVNVADNPDTVDVDESSPKFNQFIQYLQTRIAAGDTLQQAVNKAVKIQLGI